MSIRRKCIDCLRLKESRIGEAQGYAYCGGVRPLDVKHACPAYKKITVPMEDK